LPDLFKGQMLVAFGRYSGDGAAAIKVSGTVNGEHREFAQDVTFATENITNAFIPRLWATRRVGWLLDEIRRGLRAQNRVRQEASGMSQSNYYQR